MKKHSVVFTMFFVLIISVFLSFSAFATEEEFCDTAIADRLPSYRPDLSDDTAQLFGEQPDILDYLCQNMLNFTARIDISGYGLKTEDIDILNQYYGNVLLMNYELYYVDFAYTYGYSGGRITSVRPVYLVTDKTEIANTIAQMDVVYNDILSLVDNSMTDLEKLITVYNEVILMTCYDYDLVKTTPKDLLLEGTTVCQGYAGVLFELCKRMDIPCGLVRSVEMNHVWNSFYVDGEWYHADATWDDPTAKNSSRMTYTYFLKSNDYYTDSAGHYDFTPLESNSTKYDNYFWNDATSKMVILADQMYFIKGNKYSGTISVFNPDTLAVTDIYKITDKWYTDEQNAYIWNATLSGLEYDKGRLFFNTRTRVMSCKLDGTDVRVECTPTIASTDSVYGCYKKDGKLSYSVGPRKSWSYDDQTQYFIDFPENTKQPFYAVNTYKKDGKNYFSYVNDTDETLSIFAIFKDGNRFDHAEIIPVTEKEGKLELPSSEIEYEFVILNSVFSPFAEKMSVKP